MHSYTTVRQSVNQLIHAIFQRDLKHSTATIIGKTHFIVTKLTLKKLHNRNSGWFSGNRFKRYYERIIEH